MGSLACCACWACWALLAPPVAAQAELPSEEQPTEGETETEDPKRAAEYQQLITYALDEYERGSWEESAALFRRAHALVPSARTLRGLGLATYEARRYSESIRHLRAALDDTRRPLTDRQREEVEATLERAKIFVGRLDIDRSPEDAQVVINGRLAEPESDGKFMVDSGWVDVEISAPGYTPRTRRIRMAGGEEQRVSLHLNAVNSTVAARPTNPQLGRPISAPETALGSMPMSGRQAEQADSEGSPFQTWKWVAGGASVVALGVGGTMLGMQKALAPAYERECTQAEATMPPDCEERHTFLSSTLWTGSIVGFSVGGALAALTVTLFVLDGQQPESEPALVCAGMGSLGVSCRASF